MSESTVQAALCGFRFDGNSSTDDPVPPTAAAADAATSSGIPCSDSWLFFIIYGPLYGTVCAFGLIGNCLSFAVLHSTGSRQSRRTVSTYLLKALAVSDNVFLATAAGVQMYSAMETVAGRLEHLEQIYAYYQTLAWPLTHIVQLVSVWMMVLVAANRYVAVCFPLQAPRWCTRRHVRWHCAVLVVGCILYSLPRFVEFRYIYVYQNVTSPTPVCTDVLSSSRVQNISIDEVNNATSTLTMTTTDHQFQTTLTQRQPQVQQLVEQNVGLASSRLYNILYENVAYCTVAFLVPLSTLIYFNVQLIGALRRSRTLRKSFCSALERDWKPSASCRTVSRCVSHDASTAAGNGEALGGGSAAVASAAARSTSAAAACDLHGIGPNGGRDKDENNITLVMIIVIVIFIICELPAAANQVLYYVVDDVARSTCSHYMRFSHICNLIITMNSATNFVVFCLFRRQFRRQLLTLIGRCRRCRCCCWWTPGVSRGPSSSSSSAFGGGTAASTRATTARGPPTRRRDDGVVPPAPTTPPPPLTPLSTTTIDEPRPQSGESLPWSVSNQDVSLSITDGPSSSAAAFAPAPRVNGNGGGVRTPLQQQQLIEPLSDCSRHQCDGFWGRQARPVESPARNFNGIAGLSCM